MNTEIKTNYILVSTERLKINVVKKSYNYNFSTKHDNATSNLAIFLATSFKYLLL